MRLCGLVFCLVLSLLPAWAGAESDLSTELRMMSASEKQVLVIERFALRARERDAQALIAMLDADLVKNTGDAALHQYLEQAVFPFFADYEKLHHYKQITNAVLPDGRSGLWHYTYIVTTAGKVLPFRIAILDTPDGPQVLNIIVNDCVKGRHPRCDF